MVQASVEEQLAQGVPADPLTALTSDVKDAVRIMSPDEARYLVDTYYMWQEQRKRTANQDRALGESQEPHEAIAWLLGNANVLERSLARLLKVYADTRVVGEWAQTIVGIGPIIAAGLLAHIDIEQAPTVGHIWRFAGLDPTQEWLGKVRGKVVTTEFLDQKSGVVAEVQATAFAAALDRRIALPLRGAKGKEVKLTVDSLSAWAARRPWNADLKTLCWKIGESFVKVSGRDGDVYGQVYLERKAQEWARNVAGDFADQARGIMAAKKFGKDKDAPKWYDGCLNPGEVVELLKAEQSVSPLAQSPLTIAEPETYTPMLPPGHLHSRAKRYATKLFLSHYHHVAHEDHFGEPPPKPYILTQEGHAHFLGPPNWPMA